MSREARALGMVATGQKPAPEEWSKRPISVGPEWARNKADLPNILNKTALGYLPRHAVCMLSDLTFL